MGWQDDPITQPAQPPAQSPQAAPMIQGAKQQLDPAQTPNVTAKTDQPWLNDPVAQQPTQQQPSTLSDVAKSAGIGLAKGAIGLAGLPGDITSLVTSGKHGAGFGSEAIQHGIEGYTGKFYEPETTAGKYAETIGSFAPAAVLPAGEFGIGARLLRMVAAPAVASETAGELTQGTAAEPYARAGAAILGGGLGAGVRSRAAAPALMGAEDLDRAATAGYQSPEVKNVVFKPSAIQDVKDQMLASLGDRADPQLGLTTVKIINGIKSDKLSNLQNTRTLLGQLGGKFSDPLEQGAAQSAKGALDDFIVNLKQNDLLAGDAKSANATLVNARQNYFAARTLDVLQGKEYAADLSAAAANSGANYENALRQRVKGILLSRAQRSRFEQIPGAIDAMENIVRGGKVDELLRHLGNLMGGGGGLGQLMGGGAGFLAGGPIGAVATPLTGMALKKASNRIINNKVGNLSDMAAAGAPANAPIVAQRAKIAAQPNLGLDYQRALINAALSREPTQ